MEISFFFLGFFWYSLLNFYLKKQQIFTDFFISKKFVYTKKGISLRICLYFPSITLEAHPPRYCQRISIKSFFRDFPKFSDFLNILFTLEIFLDLFQNFPKTIFQISSGITLIYPGKWLGKFTQEYCLEILHKF